MSALITLVCIAGLLAAAAPQILEQSSQTTRRIVAGRRVRRAEGNLEAAAEAAVNGRVKKAEDLLESAVALLRLAAVDSDELEWAPVADRVRRVSAEVTNFLRTHAELTIVNLGRMSQETKDLCGQFDARNIGPRPASNPYGDAQGEAA